MKTVWSALSPRHKWVGAWGLVVGLALLVPQREVSAAVVARGVLGGVALVGLGGWLIRRNQAGAGFSLPERMQVVSRTGLSPRCGLALVEVDGRGFLVAFGDGFAEIRRVKGGRP